jgi:hypothetical protein
VELAAVPTVAPRSVGGASSTEIAAFASTVQDVADMTSQGSENLSYGNDAYQQGSASAARSDFQGALGVFQAAQHRLASLRVPKGYTDIFNLMNQALGLYVRASKEYALLTTSGDHSWARRASADSRKAKADLDEAISFLNTRSAQIGASVQVIAQTAAGTFHKASVHATATVVARERARVRATQTAVARVEAHATAVARAVALSRKAQSVGAKPQVGNSRRFPTGQPVHLARIPSQTQAHYLAVIQESIINTLFIVSVALDEAAQGIGRDTAGRSAALIDDATGLLNQVEKRLSSLRPPASRFEAAQSSVSRAVDAYYAAARGLRSVIIERGAGNIGAARADLDGAVKDIRTGDDALYSAQRSLYGSQAPSNRLVAVFCCPPSKRAGQVRSSSFQAQGRWTISWSSSCSGLPPQIRPDLSISVLAQGNAVPMDEIHTNLPLKGKGQGAYLETRTGTFALDVRSNCLALVVVAPA